MCHDLFGTYMFFVLRVISRGTVEGVLLILYIELYVALYSVMPQFPPPRVGPSRERAVSWRGVTNVSRSSHDEYRP